MQIRMTSGSALPQQCMRRHAGIGVDGCFVLQAALDRAPVNAALAERMALAFRQGGASVAVAALTNAAACLVSARTTLPALSALAIVAALAILIGLLLHLSLFSAVLCLDARRRHACRVDVLFCDVGPAPAPAAGADDVEASDFPCPQGELAA
jgi:hypothetical protein